MSKTIQLCQRPDCAKVREQLGKAAREIPCAGPVDHRIRVLRQQYSADIGRLLEKLEKAKEEGARRERRALLRYFNNADNALCEPYDCQKDLMDWLAARSKRAKPGKK